MARGRMVSTSIALDPEFNAMSMQAQLCFLRAVPHLDRDGLIIGQPAVLWATIAPLLPDLLPKIPAIVQEWIAAGLVVAYQTKIGPILYFDGFHKNQVGLRYDREPESRLPLPEGCERTPDGIVQVSGKVPESIRQPSGNDPLEVEVEDEVEDEVESSSATPPAAPERNTTSQQEFFAAVCEAIGWDHHTLTKDAKGRVAQTVGILKKANYTIDDVRRFMTDIWFQDFRWTDKNQRPSLNVLRNEIGKIRAGVPVDLPHNGSNVPRRTKGGAAVDAFFNRLEANT